MRKKQCDYICSIFIHRLWEIIVDQFWPTLLFCMCSQPMFSVTPSLATNANAAAAAAAAFNPYLGPVSPGLMPADILPSAPVLVTSNPSVPIPAAAAAAAAAQKLMRTDRLEVRRNTNIYTHSQEKVGKKYMKAHREDLRNFLWFLCRSQIIKNDWEKYLFHSFLTEAFQM